MMTDVWDFIRSLDQIGGLGDVRYLVKYEEGESPYGYYPWSRPLRIHIENGIINLDKPPGPTSHEVTAWVKKMLRVGKAGHAGTLEHLLGRSRRDRCSCYSVGECY
jgi:hypothetical protein